MKDIAGIFAVAVLLFTLSCGSGADVENSTAAVSPPAPSNNAEPVKNFRSVSAERSPSMPDLQAELMDDRGKTTSSPIGQFDFRNFTYPLPRGWQHPDGDEVTLANGELEPKFRDIREEMSPEEKAAARAERRIGMSYVTTRFLDANADGADDAVVILKVETGGAAIPQLVYIYQWKENAPELLWNFRTGDRADGGLKDIRVENGELVVELYGQDRFLLGQTETGKITADEEQLCCPTYFTRSFYKWNGRDFLRQRKRLTYSIANPSTPPLENFGEIMNDPVRSKKYIDSQHVNKIDKISHALRVR
ncbi:MAG: hypothetical protein AB7F88_18325 [Pyrinomonadaceae bacterium]